MLWFFVALTGYILLAITNVFDKFILTKSVPKPAVLTFYSTIVMALLLVLLPFGVHMLVGMDWFWAVISGVGYGVGLYFLFAGVSIGEQSHIAPFNGALVAVCTYILSFFFLGEQLQTSHVFGIVVLVAASLLLSLEKSKRYDGFHIGFLWAALSGLFFAISHVSAKHIYSAYDFLSGLVWTKAPMALVGLAVLFAPAVRRALLPQDNKKKKTTFETKHRLFLVYFSRMLGVAAVLCIQYAIAIGSVSLVTAMAGLQFVALFGIIFLLSTFAPKVFKETFTKREIATELLGIALVAVGLALFVV